MNQHSTPKLPGKKYGISRLVSAFNNSLKGLKFALTFETAFKQEFLLFIVLLPLLFWLPLSLSFKAILLLANCMVLITELVNSSLESVVDLVSPEYHTLAGRAKDLASAAVLISLLASVILWAIAFISLAN